MAFLPAFKTRRIAMWLGRPRSLIRLSSFSARASDAVVYALSCGRFGPESQGKSSCTDKPQL